jgi:hypothetical protein
MRTRCNIPILCVALLVISSHAHAVQPILRLSRSALQCISHLESPGINITTKRVLLDTLPTIATGQPIIAEVGILDEVGHLLKRAGTKERIATEVSSKLLQTIFFAANSDNATLLNMGQRVLQNIKTPIKDALLICVLAGGCKMGPKQTAATHLLLPQDFKIVPFSKAPRPPDGWRSFGIVEGPLPKAEFIVINKNEPEWPYFMLKALIHFTDYELIKEWLPASFKLQENERDGLFKSYVRVQDGAIEVDEAFVRTLFAGQAFPGALLALGRGILARPSLVGQQAFAITELKGFGDLTHNIFEQWHISEHNIFEITDHWVQVMKSTIEKAGS